jgi:hypothetical protein
MAGSDDPVDDMRVVGMTAAASAARVAETVIRSAQDAKRDRAHELRRQADRAGARAEADQAAAAAEKLARERYDTPERRAATDQAMQAAGVPAEARRAKMLADMQNGKHPHEAVKSPTTRRKRARGAPVQGKQRDRTVGR